jgi:hypothetical protein
MKEIYKYFETYLQNKIEVSRNLNPLLNGPSLKSLLYRIYTNPVGEVSNECFLTDILKIEYLENETKSVEVIRKLENGIVKAGDLMAPLVLSPGEYFINNNNSNRINYFVSNHWYDANFFYLKRNFNCSYPNNHIGRFYLNLTKEGVVNFIKYAIKDNTNYYSLKCFYETKFYDRSDILVLFFPIINFDFFYEMVIKFYNTNKAAFRLGTPFFLHKINDSIGFGENPSVNNYSFGSLRVNLIEKVIRNNDVQEIDLLIKRIIKKIKLEGYDLNYFYCNAYSNFIKFYHQKGLL